MKIDLDVQDSGSSESSVSATGPGRKSKGRTPERPRRPADRRPHDLDPFVTCSDGDGGDHWHRQEPKSCKVAVLGAARGGGDDTPASLVEPVLHLLTAAGKAPSADPV